MDSGFSDLSITQFAIGDSVGRSSEGNIDWHLIPVQAAPESPLGCSKFNGPFRKRLRSSVIGDTIGNASIAILLRTCSPSDVPRFVVAVVVDSIDSHSVGLNPKARQESLKGAERCMDGNSPASVIRILSGVGIGASLNHVEPTLIGRGSGKLVGFRHESIIARGINMRGGE